jgi:chromosome segregation ATPase
VSGEQRCPNCAPGYDCESGIYTNLEADLEALEAADPEVKAAAERLDNVSRNIIATAAAAGESTSARLRRVEQERDVLARQNERREETIARNVQERDQALDARDAVREQRDLARAELASAKTELGHLRRERDELREQLTAMLNDREATQRDRAEARAEAAQLRADLTAALNELLRLGHGTWIVEGGGEQKS